MSRDEKQTCANCKWWDAHEGQRIAQCRVDSPKIDAEGEAIWPSSENGDWCSKFVAREPALSDQDRKFLGAMHQGECLGASADADLALCHLGNVLYILADLDPDHRCYALDDAQAYYNARCPDARIAPTRAVVTKLIQTHPLLTPLEVQGAPLPDTATKVSEDTSSAAHGVIRRIIEPETLGEYDMMFSELVDAKGFSPEGANSYVVARATADHFQRISELEAANASAHEAVIEALSLCQHTPEEWLVMKNRNDELCEFKCKMFSTLEKRSLNLSPLRKSDRSPKGGNAEGGSVHESTVGKADFPETFISLGDAASNVIQELASKRNSQS